MTDIQPRYQHWEDRKGLVEIGHLGSGDARDAVLRSLATMHQALETFDATAALLGDRGWIDPVGGDTFRILHVRDGEWLVVKPLLLVAFVPTSVTAMMFRVADPVLPEGGERPAAKILPDIMPRGPGMRSGSIRIAEGTRSLEVSYDDTGRFRESCGSASDPWVPLRHPDRPHVIDPSARPPTPRPLGLFLRADLDRSGARPDALARMIVALDAGGLCPARVRIPAPLPGGAEGAWSRALAALRRRAWAGIPGGARFLVTDGLDGSSLGAGATREAALEAWRADLFRAKPKPPVAPKQPSTPPPPPELPHVERDAEGKVVAASTGTMNISGGGVGAHVDWPAAVPDNMPAAMIEVPDLPADVPAAFATAGFQRWVRLVGALGVPCAALVREEHDGFTLVGEGIVDIVDPARLEVDLAALDAREREGCPLPEPPWKDPKMLARVGRCSEVKRERGVSSAESASSPSVSSGSAANRPRCIATAAHASSALGSDASDSASWSDAR